MEEEVVGVRLDFESGALSPMTRGDLSPLEEVEVGIWEHQRAWIVEHFDQEASDSANVGWSTTHLDDGFVVSTKVYGHGVLTTTSTALGVFDDEWSDWT